MRQRQQADFERGNRLCARLILGPPTLYPEGSLPVVWARLYRQRHGLAQPPQQLEQPGGDGGQQLALEFEEREALSASK